MKQKIYTTINEFKQSLINENINDITTYINTLKTWFDIDSEPDDEVILLATRENGNVGDEVPGKEDLDEANRIKKLIQTKFPELEVEIEIVDEWVHIEIDTNSEPKWLYTYKYLLQKYDVGIINPERPNKYLEYPSKLYDTYNTLDELIQQNTELLKYSNVEDIKNKVEAITEYPNDSFSRGDFSDNIIIMNSDDPNNVTPRIEYSIIKTRIKRYNYDRN